MSLSQKLGLGLPKNDPFIRAINIAVVILLFCLVGHNMASGAEVPKPDPVIEITKERDEIKAKLAESEKQIGNLQATNQYLAVLAERNEMAVRLLQANTRADDLQKQLDAEKAAHEKTKTDLAKWDDAAKKSIDAGLLKK